MQKCLSFHFSSLLSPPLPSLSAFLLLAPETEGLEEVVHSTTEELRAEWLSRMECYGFDVASLQDSPPVIPAFWNSWLLLFPPLLYQGQSLWPIECTRSDGMSRQDKVLKNVWLPACYLPFSWIPHSGGNQFPCHEEPHGAARLAGLPARSQRWGCKWVLQPVKPQMTTASAGILTQKPWARTIPLNYSRVPWDRKLVTQWW